MTYDFNEEYDLDVKPIAKSNEHFQKWVSDIPVLQKCKKGGESSSLWSSMS